MQQIIDEIYPVDCLEGLKSLQDNSIQSCVTSPPYWRLRDYDMEGQLGNEDTPERYVEALVAVFGQVKRVLKTDGTLWLNLGDAYWGSGKAGKNPAYQARHTEFGKPSINASRFGRPVTGKHPEIKNKDLIGLPWMVAFALRKNGWYLRQDIIWHKPNPMPESVTDRCTKSHEYLFLLSKSPKYYYDRMAIKQPLKASSRQRLAQNIATQTGSGRVPGKTNGPMKAVGGDTSGGCNKRSVWTVPVTHIKEAHFATFPVNLISDCIKAGSRPGDLILDPFMGAGTTAVAASKLKRRYIGFELNAAYIAIAQQRLSDELKSRNEDNGS